MKDTGNFEHALITLVAAKIDERQMSHSAFGKFVFGETSGARIWRMCRTGERSRDISLNEAEKIAYFFGQNLVEFIAEMHETALNQALFVPLSSKSHEHLFIDAVKKLLAEKNIRPSTFYKKIFGMNGEAIWQDYAAGSFTRPLTYVETRDIANFFDMKYSEFMEFANQ